MEVLNIYRCYYTYITWLWGRHTRISTPRWHESPCAFCHPMPKAEGDITRQGFHVTEVAIFWYSRPRRHVIYIMGHFKIKKDHLFRFKIPLVCLLCFATATVDLEPDLISMQNKYTRGWYNCFLFDITVSGGDITVSGGWYNCFLHDFAFFKVDRYIYYIRNITWKLI